MKKQLFLLISILPLSLLAIAGCNPNQPSPEMVDEGDKRVRAFVAAVEAGNWEDANKLLPEAEKHRDAFKGTMLKLDAAFNQGSTPKFILRYKLRTADEREKFVDFVFEKEDEIKLKDGISQIRAW